MTFNLELVEVEKVLIFAIELGHVKVEKYRVFFSFFAPRGVLVYVYQVMYQLVSSSSYIVVGRRAPALDHVQHPPSPFPLSLARQPTNWVI